jgi:Uncharacterized protein conserved in bacteria (DUF2125)
MKLSNSAAIAFLLASVSTCASALAAVDAATVQQNLQAYLGSEPGVVTVVPAGDDLQITLDIMPYLKKAQDANAKVAVSPFVITAHPNGDGTWETKSSAPLNVNVTSPAISFDFKSGSFEWTGTFDEELRGFTKSHSEMSNGTLAETIVDPNTGTKTHVAYTIGKYTSDATATKRDSGIADVVASVAAEGLQGTWSLEGGNPAMGGGSFAAQKVGYQANGTGVRQRAVMDLVAWFVSHSNKQAIIKDQAGLKKALLAALPVMESMNGNETFDSLTVQSPIGNFTAQSAKIGVDMAGFVKDGRFTETFEVAGLGIPAGIAPPWSTDLIPSGIAFGVGASGFDADAPTRMFIDKMDLSKEPPISPDLNPVFAAAAMPNGTINIALPATTITAPAYSISMTGGMEMTMLGPKGGKVDIKMKGLDAVMAKLQEAAQSDPQAAQAIAGIVAAKGMAKAEADGTSSWAIVYSPEGKVSVNGLDLGAIAPPAQQ